MAEAAPALSEYEQLRVANILRNAAELKRLGLDVAAHTMAALGKQAPTARTQSASSDVAAPGSGRFDAIV